MKIDKDQIMTEVANNAMLLLEIAIATDDEDLYLISEAAIISIAAIKLNKQEDFSDFLTTFKESAQDAALKEIENISDEELFAGMPEALRDGFKDSIRKIKEDNIEKMPLSDDIKSILKNLNIEPNNN